MKTRKNSKCIESITPNHVVMTDRGYKQVKNVKEGDSVFGINKDAGKIELYQVRKRTIPNTLTKEDKKEMDSCKRNIKSMKIETKKTLKNELPQGMNAYAVRLLLEGVKELHVELVKGGFKVFAMIEDGKTKMDLVEDICDFTGWKDKGGYMGSSSFDPKFADEVIADFGKAVWGKPKRFKRNKIIDISQLTKVG